MLSHKDVKDAVTTYFVKDGWNKKESTIHSDLTFGKNGKDVSVECKGEHRSANKVDLQQIYCGIGQCVRNLSFYDDVFLAIPEDWSDARGINATYILGYIPVGLLVVDENKVVELRSPPKTDRNRHFGELYKFVDDSLCSDCPYTIDVKRLVDNAFYDRLSRFGVQLNRLKDATSTVSSCLKEINVKEEATKKIVE